MAESPSLLPQVDRLLRRIETLESPLVHVWGWPGTGRAALLEALGRDFAGHRFSLKHLMRTIARSSAYQLSSRYDAEWKDGHTPYFARHYVRMLTAEQMHDAICQATGVFGNYKHKDMVYKTDLPPFRFWTEAPTPEEIARVLGTSSLNVRVILHRARAALARHLRPEDL